MKKQTNINDLTSEQLYEKLIELRKQQYELRIKKANQNLIQTHLIQQVRRMIARVKTRMSDKIKEATG